MKNKKYVYLLKNMSFFLIFFSIIFFFYGFLNEENSAGAGGFSGDFGNSWITLQTFLNNDLLTAIKTSGDTISEEKRYISSRPPLIWILNKFINPFTANQTEWIRSIFFLSLIAPVLFYYCLKLKFQSVDRHKLILISSILLLSPYFRTSAYWGLEENYGIIFILISYIFFNIYLKEKNFYFIRLLKLFLLILSSSLCVYFDQKLLIVPIFYLLKILSSKEKKIFKIITIFFYFIFSLPFVYFIFLWKNIIPSVDALSRGTGVIFHISHIGFTLTILGFYFIPLFLFKKEKIKYSLIKFYKKKLSLFFILLFILYLLVSFIYDNYQNIPYSHLGKGYIHKLSILFFSDYTTQKIFVYVNFIFFYFIVSLFINLKFNESLIILYFVVTSIFIHPLQQEYFDPLILIIFFIFFNFKLIFYYKNIFFLYFYFLIFLFFSIIYYSKKLQLIF
jgi:hypothetical protein